MIDSRNSTITVAPIHGQPASGVVVTHHPAGTFRGMREHYRVIAGPGATDITPDALDELISDLTALRSLVRSLVQS